MADLTTSGLLQVPPKHALRWEHYSGWHIPVGRALSLDDAADVRELRSVAQQVPQFNDALDAHLEEYLALFPERHWRQVFDGPCVVVPVQQARSAAYELAYLFEIVRLYKLVERFDGAEGLIKNLRNPTQVAATFFEIESAAWCATRGVTKSLAFAPEVLRDAGRRKRPEFLWSTQLGDLHCECKHVGEFEDKFRNRANALVTFVRNEVVARPALATLRYDFVLARTHGAETSIRTLMAQVEGSTEPMQQTHGHVTLALNRVDTPPPSADVSLRTSTVPVGTSPVTLGPAAASSTVTVVATSYWQAVCARLIRDARTQLPLDSPGAVMLGLATERSAEAGRPKVELLIGHPEYENTPWIALWAQGGARLIHRLGQPFDARLGEPIGVGA